MIAPKVSTNAQSQEDSFRKTNSNKRMLHQYGDKKMQKNLIHRITCFKGSMQPEIAKIAFSVEHAKKPVLQTTLKTAWMHEYSTEHKASVDVHAKGLIISCTCPSCCDDGKYCIPYTRMSKPMTKTTKHTMYLKDVYTCTKSFCQEEFSLATSAESFSTFSQ